MTALTKSDKIKKQVEFYFSEGNLPKDKFLLAEIEKNNGFVGLALLASFSRMKQLEASLEEIIQAIESSEMLELSLDKQSIKRREPLGDIPDDLESSLYVNGFPLDYTLEQLEDYFKDLKPKSIRMRRQLKSKEFKGSVFVHLTVEQVQGINELKLKLGDTELIVKSKADYFKEKQLERGSKSSSSVAVKKEPKMTALAASTKLDDCLLFVQNLPKSQGPKELRDILNQICPVAFVEKDFDSSEALVRLKEPRAKEMQEKFKNEPLKLKEEQAEQISVLVASEEQLKQFKEKMEKDLAQESKGKRGNSNRGRPGKRSKRS